VDGEFILGTAVTTGFQPSGDVPRERRPLYNSIPFVYLEEVKPAGF
jgi:hypothetical protein